MDKSKMFFCGVDVSKNKLDICIILNNLDSKAKYFTIPNSNSFIELFFKKYLNKNIFVCFEATSNYHIELSKILSNFHIKFSILNPSKSSYFLKHLNSIKTDKTDSYSLAFYAYTFCDSLLPSFFNEKYILLKSYSSSLNLLQKMGTQVQNFIHSQKSVFDSNLENSLSEFLNNLQNLQQNLRNTNYKILKEIIPQSDEILKNSKGIGVDLAISLFPVLHFNKNRSVKQIISYLGLNPRIFESGTSVKKTEKISKAGSSNIRRILFMNALSCIRHNEIFNARYKRLIANSKPKKVAIVAVMCAIVRYLKSVYFNEKK